MIKSIEEYIAEINSMILKNNFNNNSKDNLSKIYSEQSENNITYTDETPTGKLIISALQSQNTLPVPGGKYTIYDKNNLIISQGTTDESGKSKKIILPTISKKISETPGTVLKESAEFYNAELTAENFVPLTINNIPVFEDVTTIQEFHMTFKGAVPNTENITINLPIENTL